MALLTLTVNNLSPVLSKQFSEVALIHRALELAALDIRAHGGAKTSGNILDTGAVVLGTWTSRRRHRHKAHDCDSQNRALLLPLLD
jgi:hypothetical protein